MGTTGDVKKLYILPSNEQEREFLYNMYGEMSNPVEHLYTDYYVVDIDKNKYKPTNLDGIIYGDEIQYSIDLDKLSRLIIQKRNDTIDEIIEP